MDAAVAEAALDRVAVLGLGGRGFACERRTVQTEPDERLWAVWRNRGLALATKSGICAESSACGSRRQCARARFSDENMTRRILPCGNQDRCEGLGAEMGDQRQPTKRSEAIAWGVAHLLNSWWRMRRAILQSRHSCVAAFNRSLDAEYPAKSQAARAWCILLARCADSLTAWQ